MHKIDNVVLGLHGFSARSKTQMHDAGICILLNGEVVAAVDEERLTRKKRDGNFPFHALAVGLERAGLRESDITDVAFVDRKTPWQTMQVWKYALLTFFRTGVNPIRYLGFWGKRMLEYERCPPPGVRARNVRFYEHHLCHVASAYYTAPWEQATVVSLDGMGDFSIGGMTAFAQNGKIKVLSRSNGYFSPGHFYMILTEYLGFTPGRHEGKVTGLAAYGDAARAYECMKDIIRYRKGKMDFIAPLVAEEFFNVIRSGPEGRTRHWYHQHKWNGIVEPTMPVEDCAHLKKFRRLWSQFSPEDVAAAGQSRFEDVICEYIRDAIARTNCGNLALAGGCFANVKLNQRIMEMPEVTSVWIHPNMGDGGLATGAALLHHHGAVARSGYIHRPWRHVFLGPAYSDALVRNELSRSGLAFKRMEDVTDSAAQLIASGKIIAWFQGCMEYGPRALGNRSILAPATNAKIPGILNACLGRNDFMPFAPAILEEYASGWLEGWCKNHAAANFMTCSYNVNPSKICKIPGVVHVDGTARPQIVSRESNSALHRVIACYHRMTGIPLVLNTSFNIHEEPIVCTPKDAISAFKRGAADVLIIGSYVVSST